MLFSPTFVLYQHLGKNKPNSKFSHELLCGTQQNHVLVELVLTVVYLFITGERERDLDNERMTIQHFKGIVFPFYLSVLHNLIL